MSKVQLTVQQIKDLELWEKVCEYKDWNPWILNEGLISEDEVVIFDSTFKKPVKVHDLQVQSHEDTINCWTVLRFFDNGEEVGEMAIDTNVNYVYVYKIIAYKTQSGYGTAMIQYLQSEGYTTIAGDADPDSIGFWNVFKPDWKEDSFEIYTK